MDEIDPRTVVANAESILDDAGEWPNFHDAEVLDLNFWRGDVNPDENKYVFP